MEVKPIDYPDLNEGVNAVPLSESLMRLKGHHIDDVEVTEDQDGLHMVIRSTKPSALEPDNTLAVTFSTMSFRIPKDKCEECIWKYTTKNQPIPAADSSPTG